MENGRERALVVDDNKMALSILCRALKSCGMDTCAMNSGEKAIDLLATEKFDIIFMDINMPGMDGFEVIKKIRNQTINTPIVIVSGQNEDEDTLYGLDIGADDYITKPFKPAILGAKAKALIRRSRSAGREADAIVTAGPFSYNTTTLRLYKNGREVALTAKENAMMKLFLDNANKVLTKSAIYEMVWGSPVADDQTIMVYINRLRRKIEDDSSAPRYIQTIRGLGYIFSA